MAFDPNLYAIQIELSIDATSSFDTLNELDRKIVNVEESLNRAMNSTLAQAFAQVSQLNEQLNISSKFVTDFGTQQSLNIEKFKEHALNYDEHVDKVEEQKELFADIQDLTKEQNELFDLSFELQKNLQTAFENQYKTILSISDAASQSYAAYRKGSQDVDAVTNSVDGSNTSNTKLETVINKVAGAFNKLSSSIQSWLGSFKVLIEETERFVTVNNRAYGSMHEILGQSYLTSLSFGLLREQTLAATEALIGVGASKDELESLVVTLAQVNRVTGLNIESQAEHSRLLKAAGLSAADYERGMARMIAAQRAFSLNATQMNKVLDMSNESYTRMSMLYGEEGPAKLQKTLLVFSAIARDAGATTDVIEDLNKKLTATGEELMELAGKIGANPFGDQEELEASVIGFYDAHAKALTEAGDINSQEYRAAHAIMSAQMKDMGMEMKTVEALASIRRQAGMENKTAMEIMEIYNQRIKEGQTVTGEYKIGLEGLYIQFRLLREAIQTALGPLVNFIADGMWPWIVALRTIITTIATVVNKMVQFYKFLETIVPGLRQARQVIQLLIGGFILLSAGVIVTAAAIVSFIATLASLAISLGIVTGTVTLLGGAITTFFAGATASINTFITRVSAAIARLGAALTPMIGPMLALGASILMVGAGAWLLAQAFEVVAQRGWEGLGMFTAFLAVIALFALALVGLGLLAGNPVVIAGLLAIGAAILLIGAGVALVVGSIALLVMAFTGLINAITADIGDRLVSLTNGLLYLSSMAIPIAFGLGAIGFAFAAVMIPLLAASVALMGIGLALNMIANFKAPAIGEELKKFAEELKASAGVLNEAGLALIPASVAIGAGALALLGSALTLGLAAGVMMVAGLVLVGAGALFAAGSGLFFAGATMFKTGADYVNIGATTLINSAELIPIAATALIFAAPQLAAAGLALIPAAMLLAGAAGYVGVAGLALMMASPMLMIGALAFYYAAIMMSNSIEKLEKSSFILYRFAIAARSLERLSFSGMRQGITDLGYAANSIGDYVVAMENASVLLENVRFDVTGLSDSIVVAAESLTLAADRLQVPIDQLSTRIDEIVGQVDKLVEQEARVREIGANLNTAMPDKPQDLQKPAEFRSVDNTTDTINNMVEVKNDSSEMVLLLKRMVAIMEESKDSDKPAAFGDVFSTSAPTAKLREAGIEI